MAFHTIDLPAIAIDVECAPISHTQAAVRIAILHHDGISVFDWSLDSVVAIPTEVTLIDWKRLDMNFDLSTASQLSFVTPVCMVVLGQEYGRSNLQVVSIGKDNIEQEILEISRSFEGIVEEPYLSSKLTLLALDDHNSSIVPETQNCELVSKLGIELDIFPAQSSRTESTICRLNEGPGQEYADKIITLVENGSLFADRELLVRNCTSFAVSSAHLLFTTTQHLLKVVHLGTREQSKKIPLLRTLYN